MRNGNGGAPSMQAEQLAVLERPTSQIEAELVPVFARYAKPIAAARRLASALDHRTTRSEPRSRPSRRGGPTGAQQPCPNATGRDLAVARGERPACSKARSMPRPIRSSEASTSRPACRINLILRAAPVDGLRA
jgi:hypothetical protein